LTEQPVRRPISRAEWLVVLTACVAASILASLWSWHNHALLNYGDAVAHLQIARRVFDSHRPGLSQLGSVWLPLPHLLMLPFVAFRWLWHTGIGGSFPSMLAYVFGTLGIFRLVRTVLPDAADSKTRATVRFTSWLAAAVLGTLLAVTVLVNIPARIGARSPVSEILSADTA